MDSIKSQLIDMGFHEAKITRAIESCPGAKTFEQVMEWLIAHEDELNNDPSLISNEAKKTAEPDKGSKEEVLVSGEKSNTSSEKDGQNETAANMAARKKITVDEAQRIITERQTKRAEEERKKEIEDEKRRRLDGQKMAETRAELQDQERIRLAQQIRKEKLEKELHRKSVLDQIARDREAMRLRNDPLGPKTAATKPAATPASSSSANVNQPKIPSTECKIALRFPDGTSRVQKFSPNEQLAAVRLFVQMEKKNADDIVFIAPPNRKLTESMMNDTLENLSLCPASRLEVKYTLPNWSDLD